MRKYSKIIYWFSFLCFTAIVLFLTFNRHSKSGYYNYHSEIWGDKAGYYVYLPAALKFKFDPSNFPDAIEAKTGNGFKLDYENKQILTKYTLGVALLQLPFYLLADSFAKTLHFEPNGFSPVYFWCIDVASVFYLILGLFFLRKYLKTYFREKVISLVLLSIFLATNLYYYSIDETGMSHIYSFSLFCIYIYLLQKTKYLQIKKLPELILLGIVCGLIVLIRPTNIIFLCAYFFLDIERSTEIILRIKRLFSLKVLLPVLLSAFIIILPQLIYWHHTYNSWIVYSYGGEGFNWLHPKFIEVWFSPDNGLFLYSPFYLIIILSLIYQVFKKINNAIFLSALFLVISYIVSSWWEWNFGCAFGARSFVEYLAILCIPVAYLFQKMLRLNVMKQTGFWILIAVLIFLNLKMTYTYDGCFYGSGTWDWKAYYQIIVSSTK